MSSSSGRRVRFLVLAAAAASLGAQEAEPPTIRLGLRARSGGTDRLTPLRYAGGFETKTLLYETLVRRADDGRIVPALASRWSIDDGGLTFRFELREDATFHDGKPVTARAVEEHFKRWVGLPEHHWLPANRFIKAVVAESERVVRVELQEPFALLADLVAINPCAIVGPGARDWEGEFQRPIGSGPFRFAGAAADGSTWRLARRDGTGSTIEVHPFPRGRDAAPIDALLRGELDAFVGGWDEDLPAERLDALRQDARFEVVTAPGSSVVYLSFRLADGPTTDLAVRRRIAAAIDRAELISVVEGGRADPCSAWAAPSISFWPRGPGLSPPDPDPSQAGAPVRLKIAAGRAHGRAARVAEAVAAQLSRAGFASELLAAPARPPESPATPVDAAGTVRPLTTESGEVRAAANRALRRVGESADLRVEITHGSPYCPHQSLVSRFGPVPERNADAPRPRTGVDPELMALVGEAMTIADEDLRLPIYARIQDRMDRAALVVPLYAPHRVALHRAGLQGFRLGTDVYHVDLR